MAIVTSTDGGLRAVELGATILQLRAPHLTARELEHEGVKLVARSPVPVLVSSRCDIAIAVGAAGVHLPERDVDVGDARGLVGSQGLIGRSVHSLDSALQAEAGGADFVIFGPVWPGPSHQAGEAQGLEALRTVAGAVRVPVLAIGGVDVKRAEECLKAGAAGYAAIRMFA